MLGALGVHMLSRWRPGMPAVSVCHKETASVSKLTQHKQCRGHQRCQPAACVLPHDTASKVAIPQYEPKYENRRGCILTMMCKVNGAHAQNVYVATLTLATL
jgi:hypothetical protein